MKILPEYLEILLTRFSGRRIDSKDLSSYRQFSVKFFTVPEQIANPRIEFTLQLDITEIYKNHVNTNDNGSFSAFFKWMLLKAMHSTPFNWRYINDQWYEFDNLPLFVAVRTSDEREQTHVFLYDVVSSSFEDFCKKHSLVGKGLHSPAEQTEFDSILFLICYQIERLHFPHMTSYRTTIKPLHLDSHRPSIVFSDPYVSEAKRYLPIHFSISHASLMPKLVEDFLMKLTVLANKAPREIEAAYEESLIKNNFKYAKL